MKTLIRSLSTDINITNGHDNAGKLTSESDQTSPKSACTKSCDTKDGIKNKTTRKTRGRETRIKTEELSNTRNGEIGPSKEKEIPTECNGSQNTPKRRKNR